MSAPLIGLVGAKRAGKDTFAARLVDSHGWVRFAFADTLKDVALAIDPVLIGNGLEDDWPTYRLSNAVTDLGWEEAKEDPEVRRLLQAIGVAVRDNLGTTSWIDPVLREADSARLVADLPVVITDVRFPNEVEAVERAGGKIVKIERPGQTPDDPHPSEALAWDRSLIPWATISNYAGIETLQEQADQVAGIFA